MSGAGGADRRQKNSFPKGGLTASKKGLQVRLQSLTFYAAKAAPNPHKNINPALRFKSRQVANRSGRSSLDFDAKPAHKAQVYTRPSPASYPVASCIAFYPLFASTFESARHVHVGLIEPSRHTTCPLLHWPDMPPWREQHPRPASMLPGSSSSA